MTTPILLRLGGMMAFAAVGAPAAGQSLLWGRHFGTGTWDGAYAAAPDGTGGGFVAGGTQGPSFGPHAGSFDAFVLRFDPAGAQLWSRQLGTATRDQAWAIAPDGAGGVFVAGLTDGGLFATPRGGKDAWLARYDGAGALLWGRQLGTAAGEEATSLAPDGAGGVFVAGFTDGPLLGPYLGGAYGDAFIARFDAAGTLLWGRQFGTSRSEHAMAVATDGAGGAYVAGSTDGSLFGPHSGPSFTDAFIARYDGAGARLWGRQFGTVEPDEAGALCPDGAGGAFVAGYARAELFGPFVGGEDAWIARFDAGGTRLWGRQFGTFYDESAVALAADGRGGAWAAGYTFGSLFGPNPGPYPWNPIDGFLTRYDAEGESHFETQFGEYREDRATALAADAGGAFVAGVTFTDVFGPQPGQGGGDAFVARYGQPCYPDCDPSTGPGRLDIFDFLCFGNRYDQRDPYACDCDTSTGPGACDIFDFLCFQNAYDAGCP